MKVIYVFHGESRPGKSGPSRCFTASLVLAGWSRLVCFHGGALPCRSDLYRFYTASLFLAGRNLLGVSRLVFLAGRGRLGLSPRIFFLCVGQVYAFHSESVLRRSGLSMCFTASLVLAGLSRLGFARRVSSL